MHGMWSRGLAAFCVVVWCAGCGSSASAIVEGKSAAPPYDGPLTARAAVGALECEGSTPTERFEADYQDGLLTVQSSAEAAFENHVERSGFGFHVPVRGYRVEREESRSALLSYDVRDRTKVAVVLSDGIRDWDGGRGWGVVAWARCDPSEFPAAVTDDLNIGVWEDAAGGRVPITRVRSFKGPEHCDWTRITFLLVGGVQDSADWYVRDPSGELSQLLRGDYGRVTELPTGARDTGWRRDGRRLWLTTDAVYLVDLDDPRDIERWPAAKEPVLCA